MTRIPDSAELADDISDIKHQIGTLMDKLERGYVGRELYDARHTALRTEVALEFAAMKTELESTRTLSTHARTLSMWCLGVITSAVVVALVGFVATGGAV